MADPFDEELARTRGFQADFLGLELDEARRLADRLGLQLRVIDADDLALTADLRPRRMTIDVRTGRVSTARAG
ncbi:MAG TPA: hypothetical protein VMB79_18865 [Jatrophihabitans sp.]|nr:hypothetical protein [Jatrophihabitans sp.]